MVTSSEMYWLTRFDSLKSFVDGTGFGMVILCGVALGLCFIVFCASEGEIPTWKLVKKLLYGLIPAFVVGVLIMFASVFIPTTKEYAAIKIVPAILNDTLSEDLGAVYNLGMEWAKDELQEATGGQPACPNCSKTHR